MDAHTDNGQGQPALDVNVITQPLRDARDRLTAQITELDARVSVVVDAARDKAADMLRHATEEVAPIRRQIAEHRAYIEQFNRMIAREEAAAGMPHAGAPPTLAELGGSPRDGVMDPAGAAALAELAQRARDGGAS